MRNQVSTPFSICLLGNNTGHQQGFALGLTLNKSVALSYEATPNGSISILFKMKQKKSNLLFLKGQSQKATGETI